jgi:hypothetical protein
MLTKEEKDFIKNLSNEMNTQDNRCTVQPFALVLEEKEMRIVPDGYSYETICFWNETQYNDDEWDEFIDDLKEYYEDDKDDKELIEDILEYNDFTAFKDSFEASQIEANIQYVTREYEIKEQSVNFFLTEKAYNQHIQENGHNLNEPISYGIHLKRNTEMETLIKIIHKLAKEL